MSFNKDAKSCQTLIELRRDIDQLDNSLVELLATRYTYVLRAGELKNTKNIYDENRMKELIRNQSEKIQKLSIEPDLILEIYSDIIHKMTKYYMESSDGK